MSWLSLVAPVGDFLKWCFTGVKSSIDQKRATKAREVAAEHNLKLAVLQAKITKAQTDGEWEVAAVKNAGWRADALFVIIMLPLVLCFLPGMVMYVQGGFIALSASVPDWWLALVGATAATSYGLRRFAEKGWRNSE